MGTQSARHLGQRCIGVPAVAGTDGQRSVLSSEKAEQNQAAYLNSQVSAPPEMFANSAEPNVDGRGVETSAYANHTEQAKSEGLERNSGRERRSGSDLPTMVRRFARECPQTLSILADPELAREGSSK
jgi:hypothetical protein